MPFFSIIIPAYNRLPYLLEALDSVWLQSFTDYEVIVVDDGSTDGTAEEVERIIAENGWETASRSIADSGCRLASEERFEPSIALINTDGEPRKSRNDTKGEAQGDVQGTCACASEPDSLTSKLADSPPVSKPRLRVIRQVNAGPGAALAQGEYLAFLDSDDVWLPWTLEVYRQAIDFGNGASFVSGRGGALGWEALFSGRADFHKFGCMLEACTGTILPVGGTPSVAVKRLSFEKVGGFPSGRINGEDMDLWLRLGMEPGFVTIGDPVVFQQRYHAANVSLNMAAAVAGVKFLFSQESAGRLPGGTLFEKPRKRILAATARTTSLDCLRVCECRKAWELFKLAFSEQLYQGRWKYLLAFFPMLIAKWIIPRKSKT